MSREILFKAKRMDNGEWVEGYLYRLHESLSPFIMCRNRHGESYEVDPSTVCQYTGLTDKNGKKVFEGDKLEPSDNDFDKCVVEFSNGAYQIVSYGIRGVMTNIWGWDECAGGYGVIETEPLNNYMAKGIKVIGNIYDGEGHEA